MNTLEQAQEEVGAIVEAGLNVVQAAEDIMSMFETYVVSAMDRTGHQIFAETGGEDCSFDPLKEKIKEFKAKIEVFAGQKIF